MQHLKVLEQAVLVRSEKQGRVRTYSLEPTPLANAEDWQARQRSIWERRLDQFDAYAATLEEETR